MPYCRKCGAKLSDEARFCRVCGAPVEAVEAGAPAPSAPQRRRRGHFPLVVIVLIGILGVALIAFAVSFVPFQNVNYNQSDSAPVLFSVNEVNLNFEADVADVNVFVNSMQSSLVAVNVSATGSVGIWGDASSPIQNNFGYEHSGSVLTVTSKVSRTTAWPVTGNVHVTCNVYVNPSVTLNLTIATSVGKISLDDGESATFRALTLKATTGDVEANLVEGEFLGNISVSTVTGSSQFAWTNCVTNGNISVNVGSVTGSVLANVMQTRALGGDVALDASTTTGSVNFGMNLSGNVGGMIQSSSGMGDVNVDVRSFNGNKSPIYSSNYPAEHNFLVTLGTSIGSIQVTAAYQGAQVTAQ